jgi:hypothetical protein
MVIVEERGGSTEMIARLFVEDAWSGEGIRAERGDGSGWDLATLRLAARPSLSLANSGPIASCGGEDDDGSHRSPGLCVITDFAILLAPCAYRLVSVAFDLPPLAA